MCGIVGFQLFKNKNKEPKFIINRLVNELKHRGPDLRGEWESIDDKLYLGHTRLSIIDLSEEGKQPMHSLNGRYVIVFNGEIYNYKKLMKQLNQDFSYNLQKVSDTRVLLECISSYGLNKTIQIINGMYSFVIWDKKEKKIYLVRDIYGEKPLFFYHGFDYFVFGSELKVIKSFFNNSLEINQESVHLYSCLGYIPAPYSIYKNVYKVLPGEIIEIKNNKDLKKKKYYNFPKYNTNFISSKQNLLERTHQLIEEAVKKMMTADVEIGCFLSGGIDSSLIASLMKKNSNNQIKTFSIGFKEKQYDESIYSKEIANFLKTDHHELIISNDDLLNNIEKVASIYDEPFGDSSFLPTFLLSKFASEHVKVVLSGDGGDETFLGYNRYYYAQKLLNFQKIMPYYLRLFLSNLLKGVPNGLYDYLSYPFLKFFGIHGFSSKVNKISSLMNFTDHKDFYKKLNIVDNSMLDFLTDFNIFENMQNIVKSTQMNDVNFYLSNDILVKVDRASMANSLEVRAPFLDRNLANNVFRLPVKLLLKNNQLKSILKKRLQEFLPKKLFDRPKMGFAIPLDKWFKDKNSRSFFNQIFFETDWEKIGYEKNKVQKLWKDYDNFSSYTPALIWNYAVAGIWIRYNKI